MDKNEIDFIIAKLLLLCGEKVCSNNYYVDRLLYIIDDNNLDAVVSIISKFPHIMKTKETHPAWHVRKSPKYVLMYQSHMHRYMLDLLDARLILENHYG